MLPEGRAWGAVGARFASYFNLQDIKISFEDVVFYAKLSLILDTLVGNSKTQRTILSIATVFMNEG